MLISKDCTVSTRDNKIFYCFVTSHNEIISNLRLFRVFDTGNRIEKLHNLITTFKFWNIFYKYMLLALNHIVLYIIHSFDLLQNSQRTTFKHLETRFSIFTNQTNDFCSLKLKAQSDQRWNLIWLWPAVRSTSCFQAHLQNIYIRR